MGQSITQAFEPSSSSSNSKAEPDEMIIHFTEKYTQKQALQWGKENGLRLVKSLNIGDAFVYNCRYLDACLEQSKQANKDPEVKHAYPNLIRIDQITWSHQVY